MGLIRFIEWASGDEEVSCECRVSLRGNRLFFENEQGSFDIELQPEQVEDVKTQMVALTSDEEDTYDEPERERIPDTPDSQPPLIKAPTAL